MWAIGDVDGIFHEKEMGVSCICENGHSRCADERRLKRPSVNAPYVERAGSSRPLDKAFGVAYESTFGSTVGDINLIGYVSAELVANEHIFEISEGVLKL